jgi:hypothetical protein
MLNPFDKDLITTWGIVGAASSLAGVLWRLVYVTNKLAVTHSKVESHERILPAIISGQGGHSERLAVIETVLMNLERVGPALEQLGKLSVKLDTLIEQQSIRINLLEDRALRGHHDGNR